MTGDEAMEQVSTIMGGYYDLEFKAHQVVDKVAQVVGEWQGSR